MKKAIWSLVVALSLSAAAHGQETKKHPIDKTLDDCMEKDGSTAGMVQCIGKAYEKWDKELNRVYAELMKRLPPQGKAALKETQLQWIKFRDSEFKFQDSVYSRLQGTMYIPMSADSRMQVVKNRAVELQSYIDLLKDSQ